MIGILKVMHKLIFFVFVLKMLLVDTSVFFGGTIGGNTDTPVLDFW